MEEDIVFIFYPENLLKVSQQPSILSSMIFPVGTKVILKSNVLQRHARSVPAHMGYTTAQFQWRDILKNLAGKEGIITRTFDSKYRNVDFDGQLIGIEHSELLAISPKFKGRKTNGKKSGLTGVGITKTYAIHLCKTQQFKTPAMGSVCDVLVEGKLQKLYNESGYFFLVS